MTEATGPVLFIVGGYGRIVDHFPFVIRIKQDPTHEVIGVPACHNDQHPRAGC